MQCVQTLLAGLGSGTEWEKNGSAGRQEPAGSRAPSEEISRANPQPRRRTGKQISAPGLLPWATRSAAVCSSRAAAFPIINVQSF